LISISLFFCFACPYQADLSFVFSVQKTAFLLLKYLGFQDTYKPQTINPAIVYKGFETNRENENEIIALRYVLSPITSKKYAKRV